MRCPGIIALPADRWLNGTKQGKAPNPPFGVLPVRLSSDGYGVIRGDKINRLKRVWESPFGGVETGGLEGDNNGSGPSKSPERGRRR
jgi:hypothetical protein